MTASKNAVAFRGLSTASPDHTIKQTEALSISDEIFADRFSDYRRLRPIYENSGIVERQLAMPIDWYLKPQDWSARTEVFLDKATDLFIQVARKALESTGVSANSVDGVVTVSSTGIATPSLDARAAEALGLRSDIWRAPVFGLGCAGGVAGMSLAARFAAAEPGRRVLLVVIELCSLSFRLDMLNKANIVATALFGDGAAAAVLESSGEDDEGLTVRPGCDHTWPDTLDIMGWKVDPVGFEVVFDRSIPPFARRRLPPVFDAFRERLDLSSSDVARHTFHPGGTKVIEAFETALELQAGTLDHERAILREHGNMSAPTALFVLNRALESGVKGTQLLSALGPGFTATTIPVMAH